MLNIEKAGRFLNLASVVYAMAGVGPCIVVLGGSPAGFKFTNILATVFPNSRSNSTTPELPDHGIVC